MARTLKITCNPYTKETRYQKKNNAAPWTELSNSNNLLKYNGEDFSYYATNVVKEIYKQKIERVIFEGSDDDYAELEYAAKRILELEEKADGSNLLKCEYKRRFEKYAYDQNRPTADVLREWEDKGVAQEIYDGYPAYHTERIENAYADIENLLAAGKHLW